MTISADDIATARAFIAGRVGAIETARALSHLSKRDYPAHLREALINFLAVDTETDAIPVGGLRDQWHASVREREDAKHDEAQAWAHPLVLEGCRQLVDHFERSPLP